MPDPADLTATAAVNAIQAGRLTPETLMEACLARVDAREGAVRAFAHLDPTLARQNAAGARPGALHGLPIGVKDVLDTADMPTECNSPIWRGNLPRADAAAVAWARAAGGVVMGKTVTTEFATRRPGPTTNPHAPAHTPGGSSSGSAAGVAAGFFPLAFGTQTAGSVIRPAAFCGIVGYKPSYGMISRVGHKLMSDTLDTVGVMARSVADCALLAGAVSGEDLGNPDQPPDGPPRLAVCRGPAWDRVSPETAALLDQAASRAARAGGTVRTLALPPVFDDVESVHAIVQHAESARSLGWEMLNARDGLSPWLRERMEWGLAQPAAALDKARKDLARMRACFDDLLGQDEVVLTPAAPGPAPRGLEWTGDAGCNFLWTALHVPCVTVPAGRDREGLPLGVQVVGRLGQDKQVLAFAQWLAVAVE